MTTPTRTRTQAFGTSKREGHDSSAFYSRFPRQDSVTSGLLSDFDRQVDHIWVGDARAMDACIAQGPANKVLPDNSVGLVVTSPPYFAGKEYELSTELDGVSASYSEYLAMLEAVFQQCYYKLEPGGRIAVNVANLGRKPYRSLSTDVIEILEKLNFNLRGEIIWVKSEAQNGSCAWGSFRSASNPVLRDLTERIIIGSKETYERSLTAAQRKKRGLPFENTMTRDAFLTYSTDVWRFEPESATRVGHPAPFPVELPRRLINFYTYKGDLVLDPFIGSGTTAVAALETERSYAGFDLFPEYVAIADERIEQTKIRLKSEKDVPGMTISFKRFTEEYRDIQGQHQHEEEYKEQFNNFQRRATEQGTMAQQLGKDLIEACGFHIIESPKKFRSLGVEINVFATSQSGARYYFDISGAFSGERPGLKRTDTLWKALGKASVLKEGHELQGVSYILLTTDRPSQGSSGDKALKTTMNQYGPITDVYEMRKEEDFVKLWKLGHGVSD